MKATRAVSRGRSSAAFTAASGIGAYATSRPRFAVPVGRGLSGRRIRHVCHILSRRSPLQPALVHFPELLLRFGKLLPIKAARVTI